MTVKAGTILHLGNGGDRKNVSGERSQGYPKLCAGETVCMCVHAELVQAVPLDPLLGSFVTTGLPRLDADADSYQEPQQSAQCCIYTYIGMIILSITAPEAVMDRSVRKPASELDIKLASR